jgi:ligand-binding sensor domain-containing protein/signal transduction histidine kinase
VRPSLKKRNTSSGVVAHSLGMFVFSLLVIAQPCLASSQSSSATVNPGHATDSEARQFSMARGGVPQATVAPRTIRLPVVDGNDIGFRRLSGQGLSQTRVAQILQDDQGFLWFGTENGLNRYDGYEFKVFMNEPGNAGSLSGVYIYSLFKDRSGTIWVGSDQLLDRFDPSTQTFTHYHVDAKDPVVIHISQDGLGMLWLATGNGLYRLNPVTGNIKRFAHDPNDPLSLSSNDVKSTGEDRSGGFWVATSEGLDEFDRETGKAILHIPLRVSVREFSFHEDRSGVFWIIYGSGGGLAVFDRKTKGLTRYSFYEREPPATSLTGVYSLLEDRDGTVWLGTMGAGLLKFDRVHRRFVSYRNSAADPESLTENRVIALFEDREGTIWTGLHAMAPVYFPRHSSPFERIQLSSGKVTNLGETLVNAIYEDRHGILWMGAGGSLNRLDRTTGQFTTYHPEGSGVSSEVLAILEDHTGMMWVGTLGSGLARFDRSTGRFKIYRHDPNDPSSLSSDIVTRLLIDHTGTLWAATWDGLDRFNPVTGRFAVFKRDTQTSAEAYFEVTEDREGMLWLSGDSGLIRFDPTTAKFTAYSHDPQDPGTLSNDHLNSIHVDRAGTLWVATQNGLGRFDTKTGTVKTYYQRDGISGNDVSCILEGEGADLWMSTNRGLSRFDPQLKAVKNYSAADGLPGDDLTGWGACFKSSSGEMFFGGFAGATAFRPNEVLGSTYIPPVVLTDFQVSGAPVGVESSSSSQKAISTGKVILSHKQNMFSVEFSALSFFSPATNRYRYRLEGLDSEWHEVGGERRLVNYTTLPVGGYEFQVQGATSRGPWSEPGAALRIEILPPWWSTWWFRTSCAALVVLIALAAYSYRMHQIARQFELRLEERVGERTRIARELHDTLLQSFQGLVLHFQRARNLLPDRAAEAVQTLDRALDGAEQAIVEGRDAIYDLRSAAPAAKSLAEEITAFGEELIASHSNKDPAEFRVVIEGSPQTLHQNVDIETLRIAREALRNACSHSGARRIETEIAYSDKLFRLRIRDDGKGLDPSVRDQGERTGHWGLRGMRERAQRLGGELDIWSEPGAGTEVEFRIPGSIVYEVSPARNGFRLFWKNMKNDHERRS